MALPYTIIKLAARIALLVFALIVLGCMAYMVHAFANFSDGFYVYDVTVPEWNYAIFTSVWTLLWVVVATVLSFVMKHSSIVPLVEVIGDGLTMIFWFSAFIAVAATTCDDLAFCTDLGEGLTDASAAFGAFAWLAALVAFVIGILAFLQTRKTGGTDAGATTAGVANTGAMGETPVAYQQPGATGNGQYPQQSYGQQPYPLQPYPEQQYPQQQYQEQQYAQQQYPQQPYPEQQQYTQQQQTNYGQSPPIPQPYGGQQDASGQATYLSYSSSSPPAQQGYPQAGSPPPQGYNTSSPVGQGGYAAPQPEVTPQYPQATTHNATGPVPERPSGNTAELGN